MRKFVCLLTVLIMSIPTFSGQAAANPLFGLVYPYATGYRLLVRYSDQTWQTREIPNMPLISYEQGGPDAPARPRWSADGRTIYFTGNPPGDTTNATALYAYDLASGKITPILTTHKIAGCNDAYVIESISPDGRYALMCSGEPTGYNSEGLSSPAIIDLQQKRVVSSDLPPGQQDGSGGGCAESGEWLPTYNRLLVFSDCGLMTRFPSVTLVDTRTWKTLGQYTEDSLRSVGSYLVTKPRPYYLSAYAAADNSSGEFQLMWLDTGHVQKLSDGMNLLMAEDKSFAAFTRDDRLMRLNLSTLQIADVGPITHHAPDEQIPDALSAQGDTLYYLDTTQNDNDQVDIALIKLTATTRSEGQRFYSGATPTIAMSDGPYLALDINHQQILVYKYDKLIWSNESADPNTYFLSSLSGSQVFLDVNTASGSEQVTVNAEDGTTPTPDSTATPELNISADYQPVIEGPDGWWVYYSGATQYNYGARPLQGSALIYNQHTGEKLSLFDTDTVVNNSQVAPYEFISWSPPLGKP